PVQGDHRAVGKTVELGAVAPLCFSVEPFGLKNFVHRRSRCALCLAGEQRRALSFRCASCSRPPRFPISVPRADVANNSPKGETRDWSGIGARKHAALQAAMLTYENKV